MWMTDLFVVTNVKIQAYDVQSVKSQEYWFGWVVEHEQLDKQNVFFWL